MTPESGQQAYPGQNAGLGWRATSCAQRDRLTLHALALRPARHGAAQLFATRKSMQLVIMIALLAASAAESKEIDRLLELPNAASILQRKGAP